MSDTGRTPPPVAARVARLWRDDDPARMAGHLVTRVCTHWDTVGPHAFPRHVNPEPRVQWRVHFDDEHGGAAAEDVYSDDPDAPPVVPDDATTHVVVRGLRLRVEWLAGRDAAAAWELHGW